MPLGFPPSGSFMPIKKSHLEREVDRAALGIIAGEELGFVIEDLRREDTLLEGDDLGHLIRCGGAEPAHDRGWHRPPGSRGWARGHPT